MVTAIKPIIPSSFSTLSVICIVKCFLMLVRYLYRRSTTLHVYARTHVCAYTRGTNTRIWIKILQKYEALSKEMAPKLRIGYSQKGVLNNRRRSLSIALSQSEDCTNRWPLYVLHTHGFLYFFDGLYLWSLISTMFRKKSWKCNAIPIENGNRFFGAYLLGQFGKNTFENS